MNREIFQLVPGPWADTGGVKSFVRAWLLRDNFTTDRAAGSVNDTAAEPGPGVRLLSDSSGGITISGGYINLEQSTGAWHNVQYAAIDRVAGIAFLGKLIIPNDYKQLGFAEAQSSVGIVTGLYFIGSAIQADNNGPAIGNHTGSGIFAVVLRDASGCFLFADNRLLYISTKVAVPLFPTLASGNTLSGYAADYIKVAQLSWLPSPLTSDGFTAAGALATSDGLGHAEGIAGGIGSGGGRKVWTGATWTAAAGKASNTPGVGSELVVNGGFDADTDWLKGTGWTIPGGGVAVGTAVSDTIFQTSSANVGDWGLGQFDLVSRSAGIAQAFFGAGGGGDFYSSPGTYVNTRRFVGNEIGVYANSFTGEIDNVSIKTLTLSTLFASTTHSTADVLATVAVTLTAGTQAGLVVNLDSAATPANFVIAYHDGTNCKLEKCVAGTYTTVITAAATYSAGAELRVIKDGTAYRLYYNNALVGTGTIADAGIISNTLHGLFSTYSANTLDNLTIYARGTAGEYDAPLNEVANG